MLFCITNDDQLINCLKKLNFVKINFHLNENIEWHYMQLGLNLDWIELN
jgi:hypothetical protein